MPYILTLVAVLGVFLWVTPAQTRIADVVRSGIHTIESTAASGSAPLTASLRSAGSRVREKAMELLRKELHRTIDGLVQ